MKPLRNALVYKASLPAEHLLEEHLKEEIYQPIGIAEFCKSGFVEIPDTGSMVADLFGVGLAFAFRIDEKIVPGSVLNSKTKEAIEKVERLEGRKVGRKERKEIKEAVRLDLIARALVRTSILVCYYNPDKKLLIVPTTSKKVGDIITGKLIKAIGSVEFSTIVIDDIKLGLTTRLRSWLDGDKAAFDEFSPAGFVQLERKADSEERISFDLRDGIAEGVTDSIIQALDVGFSVKTLELWSAQDFGVAFRVTSDFAFKGIKIGQDPDHEGEYIDAEHQFRFESSIELMSMKSVLTDFCDLMGYKEPEASDSK